MSAITSDKTVTRPSIADLERAPYRVLPHNLEAEQGLLGALLVDNRALDKIDALRPYHFFAPPHQRIFEAIEKLVARGQTASPVTLKDYFVDDEDLKSVGGAAYLADLAASVVTVINAEHYAEQLRELYMRRGLIGIGEDLVNDAFSRDMEKSALDHVSATEEALYRLAADGDASDSAAAMGIYLRKHLDAMDRAVKGEAFGVATGIKALDNIIKALQPGRVYTLAGRTSIGKTALALSITHNIVKAQKKVLYCSLEMGGQELIARLIARLTGISTDRQDGGDLRDGEFRKLVEAMKGLHALPLKINERARQTLGEIRAEVRKEIRGGGLDLLVIDNLTLMGDSLEDAPMRERVSYNTRGIKSIAKDFGIPVLMLAQVNRGVENRENKRPGLADLKESGTIEEDSDVVMFVFREEYYLENEPEPAKERGETPDDYQSRLETFRQRKIEVQGKAEIIVGKNRGGPLATAHLRFDGERQSFDDL